MNQQTVLEVFRFQRTYLSWLVDDIADDRMAFQPPGLPNHPAWQLGHLCATMDSAGAMLGGTKALDGSWNDRFGMGSRPTSERSRYPSKSELLKIFDERRENLVALFERAPAEKLNAPNPVATIAKQLPTVADMMVFLMLFHEGTHLGQMASWRKAAGMPEALSKLRG